MPGPGLTSVSARVLGHADEPLPTGYRAEKRIY